MTPIPNKTPNGTAYATLPIHPGGPAPTVLLFAMSAVQSLTIDSFNRTGTLLHALGWNVVSLDMPCHGDDIRPGEPPETLGWVKRIGSGENIITPFKKKVNDVIDHLIRRNVIDPKRLAATGTSRGGFMAFHAAAGNPAIRAVAALAPVTDYRQVSEFADHIDNPLVHEMILDHSVESLADRWLWITVGNNDDRVGSTSVVNFVNLLTAENLRRRVRAGVTLHLLPTPGHASFAAWHDDAADWISGKVCPNR
jgi:pimeloyl-ACP methyl ester carboxylesterase